MKIKSGAELLLFYLFWLVTLALGAWFVILGREAFETYLGTYYIKEQGQFMLSRQARLWDMVVSVALWILWFALMIITEEYYRRGMGKHALWQRFARVVGIILVLIFIVDFLQNLMLGISTIGGLRWLLTLVELLAGAVLIYFSRKKTVSVTPGSGGAGS